MYLIVPISKFRRYVFQPKDKKDAEWFAELFHASVVEVKANEIPAVGHTIFM